MSNKLDIDYTYLHDAKCRLLAYINPPDRQAEQMEEEIKRELHNAVYHHRDKWKERATALTDENDRLKTELAAATFNSLPF